MYYCKPAKLHGGWLCQTWNQIINPAFLFKKPLLMCLLQYNKTAMSKLKHWREKCKKIKYAAAIRFNFYS